MASTPPPPPPPLPANAPPSAPPSPQQQQLDLLTSEVRGLSGIMTQLMQLQLQQQQQQQPPNVLPSGQHLASVLPSASVQQQQMPTYNNPLQQQQQNPAWSNPAESVLPIHLQFAPPHMRAPAAAAPSAPDAHQADVHNAPDASACAMHTRASSQGTPRRHQPSFQSASASVFIELNQIGWLDLGS
ncbi:hypothetical protein RI054_16g77710 [Pseudoscourfieldia marina]